MSDSSNLPPADDISVVADDPNIKEDEREEIEREIDALVSRSGQETSVAPEFLQPRKNGAVLPVLIWVLAGAAFAGGFLYISNYFQVREEAITLESRGYFSTEQQLIEQILRESEARLAEKDEEIGEIQSRLAQLDQEKQNLEENLEEEVAERAAELRAELEAELAAERARLAEAGQSEEEIDQQLAALEAEREAEVAAQLQQFREEAQAEVAELQAQLESQEAQLQQTLESSREERERLADEAAQREAELRAQFTEEIAELEESERAALQRVDELQRIQEEQALLTDRVLGSFTVIVQDIEEGLTDEALAGLRSLERLLLDEGVGSGDRQRRRQTELALVTTLRGLVQEVDVLRQNLAIRDLTTTDAETARVEQERAAELIRTAADTVALAEQAREAGRFSEARSLYQQALATIPSLEQVYPGILDLESARRELALRTTLNEATTLLDAGQPREALERLTGGLEQIATGEADVLLEVASGIDTAAAESRREIREAGEELAAELRAEISGRDNRIAELQRDLAAAENAVATATETAASLRTQLERTRAERDAAQARADEQSDDEAALRSRISELEDELAAAETDLRAARSRSESLQESLNAARERASALETEAATLEQSVETRERELESATDRAEELQTRVRQLQTQTRQLQNQIATLETEVGSLEEELAARPEAAPEEPAQSVQDVPAATQEEIDELNAAIARQESQIRELQSRAQEADQALEAAQQELATAQAELEDAEEAVASREGELADVRSALADERSVTDDLRAQLEEAGTQVAGLEERVRELQESRSTTAEEADVLQQQVEELTARVAELQALETDLQALSEQYAASLERAQSQIENGNYERARRNVLQPFELQRARELFPGFLTTLDTAHDNLLADARAETGSEVRQNTLEDVISLATEVQQNIQEPREAVSVQSYLSREPELRPVANELFEIVELSERAISAPEVEYRLLGSVSRVTGNLVVVERLVELEPEVGDSVEIRRTPALGQEVDIATGTVLEITDQRVVVSVDEIFDLETPPASRDLAYVAQE